MRRHFTTSMATTATPGVRARASRARWTTRSTRARVRGDAQRARASREAYDGLWMWLERRGADVSRVVADAVTTDANDSSRAQFGVRAKTTLRRGTRAMVIPREVWMDATRATEDADVGAALRDARYDAVKQPWVRVALLLLKERERGADVEFAAYVATLPKTLDSPLFWNADELRDIAGTQLLDNAAGYDAYVRAVYEELKNGVFVEYASTFDVDGAFDEASFRWAFGILRSRTMAPLDGANVALVPGLDLINHSSLSGARWRVGGGGGMGGLFGGGSGSGVAAYVECDRDYEEGAEIFVNYDPEGIDSKFALDYGFIDVVNPSPGYALTLSIPEDDANLFDKLDVLETQGLPEAPTFTLRPYSDPDRELRTFLRLLHCKDTDAFLLEALFRQQCWSLISEPLSRENEADCCASVTRGVADALSAYETRGLDQEKAFLTTPPNERQGGIRQEIAVRARLSEKSALLEASAFFDVVASSLDKLEYYQERRLRSLNLLNDDGSSTYDPFNETMA